VQLDLDDEIDQIALREGHLDMFGLK
jgi:hypothetical protein